MEINRNIFEIFEIRVMNGNTIEIHGNICFCSEHISAYFNYFHSLSTYFQLISVYFM